MLPSGSFSVVPVATLRIATTNIVCGDACAVVLKLEANQKAGAAKRLSAREGHYVRGFLSSDVVHLTSAAGREDDRLAIDSMYAASAKSDEKEVMVHSYFSSRLPFS